MSLYESIFLLAKEKGLTICGLCKKAGVPTSVLYDIKSGRKQGLSRGTAEKIASALEISVDELYGKEKSPDAEQSTPRDERYNEIFSLLESLPEEKAAEALRYLKYLADN